MKEIDYSTESENTINIISLEEAPDDSSTPNNSSIPFNSTASISSTKSTKSNNPLNSMNIMKYLYEKDYENKVCVECKSPMPTFASINNGILVCAQCGEKLEKLGYNISFIRELKEEWDQYLLSFLERGGNSRFIRFSKQYDLEEMPIEEKFQTKIVEYYRLLVSIK